MEFMEVAIGQTRDVVGTGAISRMLCRPARATDPDPFRLVERSRSSR